MDHESKPTPTAAEWRRRAEALAEQNEALRRVLRENERAREAALRVSQERLQLALASGGMGAFEWDIRTDHRTWDETGYRLLGADPQRFEGTTAATLALLHPEDREVMQACIRRALESGDYQLECRVLWPDASVHHIAARGKVFRDDQGRPARLIGVLWDISERKRIEEALLRERTFSRALLDNLVEGVVACDDQGALVLFNRTLREWQGLDPAQLPMEAWAGHYDLFQADGTTPMATQAIPLVRAFNGEVLRGAAMTIRAQEQPVRHLLANGAPILDPQGRRLGAVVVMHDITARKATDQLLQQLNESLEERIRQRTALLEAANAELDAFSYSVSHDLRAPLRGIDGFSQALLEECGERLDATGRHYLQRVRAGTRRMGQLIDDLLQLSRVSRSAIHRRPLDLGAMAGPLLEELRQRDPARSLTFAVEPGLLASGDQGLVRSVLENLLGNAWKYSARVPAAHIELFRETQPDGTEAFCVRDNGAGFDMAYAGKLFTAFQRLHSTHDFEGSGIGLAIVQRIIARHGGRVWARGAVDQGASFYFTLPGQP